MRYFCLLPTAYCLLLIAAPAPTSPFPDSDAPAEVQQHPVVPPSVPWAGAVVIGILGTFFAAAVVGMVVRSHAPGAMQEIEAQSHDEPPGASHHHGPTGTEMPGRRG